MVKYKTYTNAFKWKTVLYAVNDFKLPFSLVIEQVVYFGVAEVLMILLYQFHLVLFGNSLMHFIAIPTIFTFVMMNINPEDKKPLKWLYDTMMHLTKDPKELWNFEKPEHREAGRFDSVAFRR